MAPKFELARRGFSRARPNSKKRKVRSFPNMLFENVTISNSNSSETLKLNVEISLVSQSDSSGSPLFDLSNNTSINMKIIQCTDKKTSEALKFLSQYRDKTLFLQTMEDARNSNKIKVVTLTPREPLRTTKGKMNPKIRVTNTKNLAKRKYFYPLNTSFENKGSASPEYLTIFAFMYNSVDSGIEETIIGNSIEGIYYQSVIQDKKLQNNVNIADLREFNFEELLDFEILGDSPTTKEDYFSEIFQTIDQAGFIKFMFFWDKEQFIIEKSLYGNMLSQGTNLKARQKMLNYSKISNLSIFRRRIKKTLGFEKQISSFDLEQVEKVIVSSADDDAGNLMQNTTFNFEDSKTAEIKESLEIKNVNYRSFFVNDYGLSKFNFGKYQYGISIRVEDGILKYLVNSLMTLNKNITTLEKYYTNSSSPMVSTPSVEKTVDDLLSILSCMKKINRRRLASLRQDFKQNILSQDGTARFLDLNMKLASKIESAIGKSYKTSISNKGKSKVKNELTSDLFILGDEKYFNNYIDIQNINDIVYNYLGIEDDLSVGASGFSVENIKNRFFDEFTKLIVYDDNMGNINFSEIGKQIYEDNIFSSKQSDIRSSLFDFRESYYSYLSPAQISDEEIDNLSRANWQNAKYNNLEFKSFNSLSDPSMGASYYLQNLGVYIEDSDDTFLINPPTAADQSYIPSDKLFGTTDKVVADDLHKNIDLNKATNVKESMPLMAVANSQPVINGISKFYYQNGIQQLNQTSFDLENPRNMLDTKRNMSTFDEELMNIPNHIRALFGSKSTMVRNQWENMEIDFAADPNSFNMIKENYTNLIIVECLKGFSLDTDKREEVKAPIFSRLKTEDIENISSGEYLFCRTRKYHDLAFQIGAQSDKNIKSAFYIDQYFIISNGTFSSFFI